jgi:hypothetical protein
LNVGWRDAYAGRITRHSADPDWDGQKYNTRVECIESVGATGTRLRTKAFHEVAGGLPAQPQVDTEEQSLRPSVVIDQTLPFAEEHIEISYIDHASIRYFEKQHFTDSSGRPDIWFEGVLLAV